MLPTELYDAYFYNETPLSTTRLLNHYYKDLSETEMEIAKRNYIFTFIKSSFTKIDIKRIDESIEYNYRDEWYYNDYDSFIAHQKEMIFNVDMEYINYLLLTIKMIKNQQISQINREEPTFYDKLSSGFCFINGKLTFLSKRPKTMVF
jgi:hypothetical protein